MILLRHQNSPFALNVARLATIVTTSFWLNESKASEMQQRLRPPSPAPRIPMLRPGEINSAYA